MFETKINQLTNFPFSSLMELDGAFKQGVAEPIVPVIYAREWASRGYNSPIKLIAVLLSKIIPLAGIIGLIYLTYNSEVLKWYHSLGIMFGASFSFVFLDKILKLTMGVVSSVIITIVFYFTNPVVAYAILFSLCIPIGLRLTEHFALIAIVNKVLSDEEFVVFLWNEGLLSIRFTNGKIVSNLKKNN